MDIQQSIYDAMNKKMSEGGTGAAIPLTSGASPVQLQDAATPDSPAPPDAATPAPVTGNGTPDPAHIFAAGAPEPAATTFDPNTWLDKQTSGKYKTWEEVQSVLDKPAPEPIQTPLSFVNDTSKQIYELLSEGRDEEVLPYIQSNVFAKKVPTMPPQDVLKAKIASEYPSLSSAEVEEEFQSRYVPDGLEMDAVVFEREKKKANDRMKRDAAEAITYFSGAAQTAKLPPVVQQTATPQVQPLSSDAQLAVTLGESFASDKVSTVPFEFAVPDSQIKVQGQTFLPKEAIDGLQAKISKHPEAFLAGVIAKRWGTANGTLDSFALARDIYALDNLQQIGNKVAEQSYNQVIIEKMKADKNYQTPGVAPSGGFTPDNTAEDAMNRLFRVPKA